MRKTPQGMTRLVMNFVREFMLMVLFISRLERGFFREIQTAQKEFESEK
jgi:hypothetical protein